MYGCVAISVSCLYQRVPAEMINEDIISRKKLLKELEELNAISFFYLNEQSQDTYNEIKRLIENMESICEECMR